MSTQNVPFLSTLRAEVAVSLNHEHLLARVVDPNTESAKITRPESGAIAVSADTFDNAFGEDP